MVSLSDWLRARHSFFIGYLKGLFLISLQREGPPLPVSSLMTVTSSVSDWRMRSTPLGFETSE